MDEIKSLAGKAVQGALFDDALQTVTKDILKPKEKGQSDVSYGASKAIPFVTGAIGGIVGNKVGGGFGTVAGIDVGVHLGSSIQNFAEKQREQRHPLASTPTHTQPVPPIAYPESSPQQPYYIVYGGPGAGVPQYPYEPVIHPKRGRRRKTHRRKAS